MLFGVHELSSIYINSTQVEVPDGSENVQTVSEGKFPCPYRPRREVRSCPGFRALARFPCVQQIFVRSCPDFCAFIKLSCVHFKTFLHSCPDFSAFTRISCVGVQALVCSCPDFCAFTRISYIHVPNFKRTCPPDFRSFMFRLLCVFRCFWTM